MASRHHGARAGWWRRRAAHCLVVALVATGALAPVRGAAGETGAAMAEGSPHRAPRAWAEMCARSPMLCDADIEAARRGAGTAGPAVPVTADLWKQLDAVNRRINQAIARRDDIDIHGRRDVWSDGRAQGAGDCEDFAIAKKQELLASGRWQADQLLYAVVETWSGYHAVLVVRTEDGDFVLDNLRERILRWDDTDYDFVIRQSAAAPDRWVRLADAPPARTSAAAKALRPAERADRAPAGAIPAFSPRNAP